MASVLLFGISKGDKIKSTLSAHGGESIDSEKKGIYL